jgi:outer membrane protein insertion porin family
MYAFYDAGGLYGPDESISLGDLRSSVGVGISWISPVGPLRLAYAKPITQFDSDKIQPLQFTIGTTF